MIRGILLVTLLATAGCSSSPYAPINQITPIRQMDSFFNYINTPVYPVDDRRQCCCCCSCDHERG